MNTKDLLAARTRQMARKTEDLEIAAEKLEKAKIASKLYFNEILEVSQHRPLNKRNHLITRV